MISESIEEINKEINKEIGHCIGFVIGIDGYDGAGKTTLGEKISEDLNIEFIDLDKYILNKEGSFIDKIDKDSLKSNIRSFIANGNVIISGVCLMKVLENINVKIDLLIYVMRYDSHDTCWLDEDDCNMQGDPMKEIKKKVEFGQKILGEEKEFNPNADSNIFRNDMMLYHQQFKPHKNADIIYKRIEKY